MCEAPICNCHRPCGAPPLKLEVDKTYITKNNTHVKILFYNEGRYIGQAQDTRKYYEFHSKGLSVDQAVCSDLSSEYKEPEYWYVNIYDRGPGAQGFTTRFAADAMANNCNNPKSRKGLIRINKETFKVEQLPL